MGHKPTEEQLLPIDTAIAGHNLIIKAYAGTGKSTTLKFIADQLKHKRILYTTFGKENIVSARGKFGKNVFCATAHALAFRFVDQKVGLITNKLITSNLGIKDIFEAANINPSNIWGRRKQQIATAAYAINIIETFCKSIDYRITPAHFKQVFEKPPSERQQRKALQIAKLYWNKAYQGKARMNHDMYLKMWHVSKPILDYDVILFDEAQDADALMIDVVKNQSAQLIAVGDTHQQIYSFRGAINALNHFGIERQLKLTQSFRYGPLTAELSNQLLYKHKGLNPGIKGNPALNTRIERYYVPHDVIIGRTLGSLFGEMFKMYKNGFTDFACLANNEEMLNSIYAITALRNGKKTYHPFISTFDSYAEFEEYCKHAQSEAIPTYNTIIQQHSTEKVIGMLNMLGTKRKAQVVFLTAHKCKGLEFDNVTLLNDFVDHDHENWEEEETNLAYVASTRAIKTLNIGNCSVFADIGHYKKKAYGTR